MLGEMPESFHNMRFPAVDLIRDGDGAIRFGPADLTAMPNGVRQSPVAVVYADETELDVETYIQPLNPMGFLMQLEVDWVARIIQGAKKPVITIKTMAAGQVRPFQAMTFVWNVIRDCDMVTVGTMAPEEATELVQLSLDVLARRPASLELQKTRSKATVTGS